MVFSVAALALTEKDLGFMKSLGKVDEVCREKAGWKKVELEEAREDLMKGEEGEVGVVVLA